MLLNGGKVAGILLESAGQGGAVDRLAIGIGVNLVEAPPRRRWSRVRLRRSRLLGETGMRIAPEEFLDLLAAASTAGSASFATYGFGPIRDRLACPRRAAGPADHRAHRDRDDHRHLRDAWTRTARWCLPRRRAAATIPAADVFF